jgi:hypothetical protein
MKIFKLKCAHFSVLHRVVHLYIYFPQEAELHKAATQIQILSRALDSACIKSGEISFKSISSLRRINFAHVISSALRYLRIW